MHDMYAYVKNMQKKRKKILLFVLSRSASVDTLQIMYSNSSCESTANWETCQIFRGRSAGAYVTKTATVLGVSIAAVSIVMTVYTNQRHHQLRGLVAENQNSVKGIAVH
jgi:preprotein translocase subunit SecG